MPGSCTLEEKDDNFMRNREFKLEVKRNDPILVCPAEPTEKQVYFLSNLDQLLALPVDNVFFFHSRKDKSKKAADDPVAVIKESLRKVLVLYYPLAGRLSLSEDLKLQVECEGQGVVFVEAVADCSIAELGALDKPVHFMAQFLYNPPNSTRSILDVPPMCVQVTRFKCGGFSLGLVFNHCIVDLIAESQLLSAWSELARGSLDVSHLTPHLDRTVLNPRSPPRIEFPHLEMSCDVDEEAAVSSPLDEEKEEEYHPNNSSSSSSSKNSFFGSFSLSPEKVESLKRQTLNEGLFTKVTAFEVLAALTWRARTQALDMPPTQVARLLFPVNVRDKLDPPLPKRFMGNGILFAHAAATATELATISLAQTVKLVQDAKAMITDRYVRSAIDFFEVTRAQMIGRATLFVSSWVGIPIHLVDFGWGQPMCALPGTMLPEDAILAPSTCFSNLEAADSSLKLCIALHSQEAVDRFGHCLSSNSSKQHCIHSQLMGHK
ncbi:unnamed protein product [Sphagnum troendelagicum]